VFNVFPNPARNVPHVKTDGQITISDAMGQIVYKGNAGIVDVSKWSRGIYFVLSGGGVSSKVVLN
ncbi:MAG: T9SS type A sorting domain-containing protein, partial [Flavobacteriales bacterium]|nr:T9SS type A sorting domain-containing protein [Flavobacteriales bacterium]